MVLGAVQRCQREAQRQRQWLCHGCVGLSTCHGVQYGISQTLAFFSLIFFQKLDLFPSHVFTPTNLRLREPVSGVAMQMAVDTSVNDHPSLRVCVLSRFHLFVTPGTVAHQALLSMVFSQQEYWSWLPFPSPGDLSNPGIKPASPTLKGGFFFIIAPLGKPKWYLSLF